MVKWLLIFYPNVKIIWIITQKKRMRDISLDGTIIGVRHKRERLNLR